MHSLIYLFKMFPLHSQSCVHVFAHANLKKNLICQEHLVCHGQIKTGRRVGGGDILPLHKRTDNVPNMVMKVVVERYKFPHLRVSLHFQRDNKLADPLNFTPFICVNVKQSCFGLAANFHQFENSNRL